MLQLQQNVFVVLGFVAVALIVALPVRGQLAQSLRGLLSVFDFRLRLFPAIGHARGHRPWLAVLGGENEPRCMLYYARGCDDGKQLVGKRSV